MTAKMTDAEINELTIEAEDGFWNGDYDDETFSRIVFRQAESIYLPQIQQLHGEIERLNTLLENEKATSRAFERGFDGMKEAFFALTAKREKLVKGLKELNRWNWNTRMNDGYNLVKDGQIVLHSDIQKLLTESEDKG